MPKKTRLFSLQTFSATGGIQKMTRTLAYSLNEIAKAEGSDFSLWSLYDADSDVITQYLPAENFKGFNNNRLKFIWQSLQKSFRPDVVIISHVNLALVGLLIKTINPKCKLWLIAHGIEVWRPLSLIKKSLIKHCDKILCVSTFTKQELIKWHAPEAKKCVVLNNAVDPFIILPHTFDKPDHLIHKYHIPANAPVLFTLTRLSSSEQYKGYDKVIKTLAELRIFYPDIKYVLAGKYDDKEKIRIRQLITKYRADDQVILTGFIEDEDLTAHFLLADLFVLPSKKEGFGIVLIEALARGLPVICGNSDGSTDAIKDGELGKAIPPDDLSALETAVKENLSMPLATEKRRYLQSKCLEYFNEQSYQTSLKSLLIDQ
jgi:phosphatidylinositol alpha-1,6-mannosyltransferase